MQSVVETVGKMDKAWQGKRKTGFRGKVTSRFHKVCGTLDSHQSLLKVLPEGSHYVSLFSGTLNAVITVMTISTECFRCCCADLPGAGEREL